jgi:hypothetical protein
MRGLGVWLVGLGIVLLVMCVFPVAAAGTTGELIGWLACAGLVPGSLIGTGIVLVRRAEGRGGSRESPPGESATAPAAEPVGILDRVGAFDLNRPNWVGRLLLLGTFGFIGAEAAVLVWLLGPGGWDRRLAKLAALPMLLLAVGFFAGVRRLLGHLGVSVYRPEGSPAEPSAADRGRR